MPYSAVTQPLPVPLQEGRRFLFQAGGDQHMGVAELAPGRSLRHGVEKPGSRLTGRIWSGARLDGAVA